MRRGSTNLVALKIGWFEGWRALNGPVPSCFIALVGRILDSGDGVLVWFTQESGTLRDPADVLAGSSGKQTLAIL